MCIWTYLDLCKKRFSVIASTTSCIMNFTFWIYLIIYSYLYDNKSIHNTGLLERNIITKSKLYEWNYGKLRTVEQRGKCNKIKNWISHEEELTCIHIEKHQGFFSHQMLLGPLIFLEHQGHAQPLRTHHRFLENHHYMSQHILQLRL